MKRRQFICDAGRTFLRNTGGAAAVESAFIYPLFLAVGLFSLEAGRVLYSKVEFEYAIHSATRFGMVSGAANKAAIQQALGDKFVLLHPENLSNVQLTEVANGDNTRTATLTVAYNVDLLIPFTSHQSITLTKSVTFLRGS